MSIEEWEKGKEGGVLFIDEKEERDLSRQL
jgi:hypothetical protein